MKDDAQMVVACKVGDYTHMLFQLVDGVVIAWNGWKSDDGEWMHIDPATCQIFSVAREPMVRRGSLSREACVLVAAGQEMMARGTA